MIYLDGRKIAGEYRFLFLVILQYGQRRQFDNLLLFMCLLFWAKTVLFKVGTIAKTSIGGLFMSGAVLFLPSSVGRHDEDPSRDESHGETPTPTTHLIQYGAF